MLSHFLLLLSALILTLGPMSCSMQYLMNHFLDINTTILGQTFPVPDRNSMAITNGLKGTGSLTAQVAQCNGLYGYPPTFTLVDYFDVGSVFRESLSSHPQHFRALLTKASR